MVSRPDFDFHRQCIVVADDASPAATLLVDTLRLDGHRVDVSLSVSPVRQADGTIVAVAKSIRDITEQKRLAREIAAQQEWFRVTLGSIGDGVIASRTRPTFATTMSARPYANAAARIPATS